MELEIGEELFTLGTNSFHLQNYNKVVGGLVLFGLFGVERTDKARCG